MKPVYIFKWINNQNMKFLSFNTTQALPSTRRHFGLGYIILYGFCDSAVVCFKEINLCLFNLFWYQITRWFSLPFFFKRTASFYEKDLVPESTASNTMCRHPKSGFLFPTLLLIVDWFDAIRSKPIDNDF